MSRRMAKAGGGTFTPPGLRPRTFPAGAVGLFFVPTIRAADPDLDSLRPGLVAKYRSLVDPTAALSRIDAKPAFSLSHSSPHPRLPTGLFEATWTGQFVLSDEGPILFTALLC